MSLWVTQSHPDCQEVAEHNPGREGSSPRREGVSGDEAVKGSNPPERDLRAHLVLVLPRHLNLREPRKKPCRAALGFHRDGGDPLLISQRPFVKERGERNWFQLTHILTIKDKNNVEVWLDEDTKQ